MPQRIDRVSNQVPQGGLAFLDQLIGVTRLSTNEVSDAGGCLVALTSFFLAALVSSNSFCCRQLCVEAKVHNLSGDIGVVLLCIIFVTD